MPVLLPSTGSSASRACRSKSTSLRNSVTARRRCPGAGRRSLSRNRERPQTRWRRCAMRAKSGRKSSRSSISRKARLRARPMWCCRPWPDPRSASPRPRRSRPNSPCSPALRWRWRARGAIDRARERALAGALTEVASRVSEVLNHDERIRAIAAAIAEARDVLYLGRGTAYPLALEGALKLKEISYIHAEGYAAGEMKHGPIALIDESVPVIVLAPNDDLFEKTLSNVEEVMARGGRVVMVSDAAGIA